MSKSVADTNLFWKQALDSARQGVWDYDIQSGKKTHSDTWREIRGLGPHDPLPETDEEWLVLVHPDDQALAAEQTAQLNAGELSEVNYEYRERHAQGHWMWIMCRGRAVAWDGSGRPTRFVGTDTDITPLKSSEERVKVISRRLELALASVQIGIFVFHVASQRIEWDARHREIYGLPADDSALPRDIWEQSLHPEDFAYATSTSYAGLAARRDYEVDYRIIRRNDGAVRFIRSRVSYQEDLIGGPILVGINWDATEEHEASEALRRANDLAAIRNAELEAARAEMEHNALHDALMGLPNRRMLDRVQGQTVTEGARAAGRSAVLHIDLDRFKQINDVFGHGMGDFVLRNTAEVLRDCLPQGAIVARVGGDEFAVYLPESPREPELQRLAERLIARIAQPVIHDGVTLRYGISVGIAVSEGPGQGGRDLFINADLALYRAKAEGRGRACFFTDQMRGAALAQKRLADDILAGIERREFFCIYQPQFDAASGAITGVEALVRWASPERGLLLPSDFLAAAEDLNALTAIDRIVLQKATADFAAWQAEGIAPPRLSVNLSGARLRDPDLPRELVDLQIDPRHLSFELLESNFLDDHSETVATNLAAIRGLGIAIEVDDFGTGHASIVSLLKLKPERLKIDRALVSPIAGSEMQAQLLRSIVEIGHLQGIAIIAEGVETEAQTALLVAMGCDELQGFALARPMEAAALAEYLRQTGRSASGPAAKGFAAR